MCPILSLSIGGQAKEIESVVKKSAVIRQYGNSNGTLSDFLGFMPIHRLSSPLLSLLGRSCIEFVKDQCKEKPFLENEEVMPL